MDIDSAFGFVFIFLGLSFLGDRLQVQDIVLAVGVAIISIRMIRLYRGVNARMLAKARAGPEALVGSEGIMTNDLRLKGEIRVNGEFWQAVTNDGGTEKDREVEVVDMEGLVVVVKIDKEKADTGSM